MTLILPFVSHDFVALVSDRRITWQIGGATQRWEDADNKTVALAGHFLLGYAGFARLGGVPTDKWVVDRLVNVSATTEYFEVLCDETEAAVRKLNQPLERSGHAFVAVGYGTLSSEQSLVPTCITISNAVGQGYGVWRPRTDFRVERTSPPGRSPDFRLNAFGCAPTKDVLDEAIDLIYRYMKRSPSKTLGVLQLLVRLARTVAAQDDRVSEALSVSILPRRAVPAFQVTVPVSAGLRDPIEDLTCMFVPADRDASQGVVYGPATVQPGMAMWRPEIWTRKPPWWKD